MGVITVASPLGIVTTPKNPPPSSTANGYAVLQTFRFIRLARYLWVWSSRERFREPYQNAKVPPGNDTIFHLDFASHPYSRHTTLPSGILIVTQRSKAFAPWICFFKGSLLILYWSYNTRRCYILAKNWLKSGTNFFFTFRIESPPVLFCKVHSIRSFFNCWEIVTKLLLISIVQTRDFFIIE